jgi:hypothetical protein
LIRKQELYLTGIDVLINNSNLDRIEMIIQRLKSLHFLDPHTCAQTF